MRTEDTDQYPETTKYLVRCRPSDPAPRTVTAPAPVRSAVRETTVETDLPHPFGRRIAAVAGPDAGHLLPVVAIADALARRGHEVTVVTGDGWRDDLRAAGLRFAPLPRVAPVRADEDLGWRMWGRGAMMATDLDDMLRDLGVEGVVADTLTMAGGFAAERRGLPWVEVTPHWLWEPSRALPPIGLGQRPARTPLGGVLERHQRRQQRRSIEQGRSERARARAEVGLPPTGGADLRLAATVPALEPPRPDWPPRAFVVGSLEWDPPRWPELPVPAGTEPLVVVTGTTADGVEESLAALTERGLRRLPVRLVATTTDDLPERPRLEVGRGRHGPLLDRAACAVGLGGGGFVAKALTRGVPLVLVPLQGDQRETAARVERLGAGVGLRPSEASATGIARAVRAVLGDPSYGAAARRAARGAWGLGASRAATLIERWGALG